MEKFCYAAGEIEIAENQCELCMYRTEGCRESCEKYAEKPMDILLDERKCPYIRNAKLMDLELMSADMA